MVPHYDDLLFYGIKPCLNFLFAHALIIWHKNIKNQQVFDFIKKKKRPVLPSRLRMKNSLFQLTNDVMVHAGQIRLRKLHITYQRYMLCNRACLPGYLHYIIIYFVDTDHTIFLHVSCIDQHMMVIIEHLCYPRQISTKP